MMKEPGALKSSLDFKLEEKRVREINWEGVFWVIILPIIGLIAAAFTPLQTKTAIWAVIYHITTGVGITAGPCSLQISAVFNAQLPADTSLQVITGYGHTDRILLACP
jgi:fatty-acid desaturase